MRKWPSFYSLFIENKTFPSVQQDAFQQWLESNLSKEELDRIAPPECEHPPCYVVYYSECATFVSIGPQQFVSPSFYKCKCRECGVELKPTKWEEI